MCDDDDDDVVDDVDERHLVLGKQEGVDVTQPDHRQADHNEGLHMIWISTNIIFLFRVGLGDLLPEGVGGGVPLAGKVPHWQGRHHLPHVQKLLVPHETKHCSWLLEDFCLKWISLPLKNYICLLKNMYLLQFAFWALINNPCSILWNSVLGAPWPPVSNSSWNHLPTQKVARQYAHHHQLANPPTTKTNFEIEINFETQFLVHICFPRCFWQEPLKCKI